MKISIICCGYVWAVMGACLAEAVNAFCFIDIDSRKFNEIKSCRCSIFKTCLDALLERNAQCPVLLL